MSDTLSGGLQEYFKQRLQRLTLQVVDASDPQNIQLRIHEDPFCETDGQAHFQYVLKALPP